MNLQRGVVQQLTFSSEAPFEATPMRLKQLAFSTEAPCEAGVMMAADMVLKRFFGPVPTLAALPAKGQDDEECFLERQLTESTDAGSNCESPAGSTEAGSNFPSPSGSTEAGSTCESPAGSHHGGLRMRAATTSLTGCQVARSIDTESTGCDIASIEEEKEAHDAPIVDVSILQTITFVDDGGKTPKSSTKVADWTFSRSIGQGAFATVFGAKNQGEQGKGRNEAAKVIDKSAVEAADDWANVANEYEALRSFGPHPSIVCLTGAVQSEKYIYFFMDLATGKDLFDFIKMREQNGRPVPKDAVQTISTGILGALAHVHEHGLCHRDLKPENIMVDQLYNAKLVDFGCACPRYQLRGPAGTGTVPFIAPECLNEEANDGAPADVWSFGVVILEMKFGLNALMRFFDWDKAAMPPLPEIGAQLRDALAEPAPFMTQLRKKLGKATDDTDGDVDLAQMLDADPAQRPDAEDFASPGVTRRKTMAW